MKENRPQADIFAIANAELDFTRELRKRLAEKGHGIFLSSHETLGIVTEEYQEYARTVHENNADDQEKELMDIAVAAIFGIVSIRSGKMDWL
jgi:NTP pyrophosphatase (non-canonical NTP hydrolase)